MDYVENNIDPEILNKILLYLNSPKGRREARCDLSRVITGVQIETIPGEKKMLGADVQLGLECLSHHKLVTTRELRGGGFNYQINQLGEDLIKKSSTKDFLKKIKAEKEQAIKSDEISQELLLLRITELERKLSPKNQANEKRFKDKNEKFLDSGIRKNNVSLFFSFLALIVSIIHIGMKFFS